MKYIVKGAEPTFFRDWKAPPGGDPDWQPGWDDLAQGDKIARKVQGKLQEVLLREQGWLCCYCCIRIEKGTSHIEHIQSRVKYKAQQLAFANLLASCYGVTVAGAQEASPEKEGSRGNHCGPHKGNQPLQVTPPPA